MRIAPYNAVKFLAAEKYRPYFAKEGKLSPLARLVCGASAGITAVAATYPLDVIKTRLTVQTADNKLYNGVFDAFFKIWKNEGFSKLYSGFPTTVFGAIPYEGGQFFAYSFIQDKFKATYDRPMTTVENLLAGCAAGFFAQFISYPFDTVRKRLQTQAGKDKYGSMGNCFVRMVLDEGIPSLFTGQVPNAVKVVPYSGITMVLVTQFRDAFRKQNALRAKKL
jgi:solute carrier family 25 phosphate transporter 23/24/25/41